MDLRVLFRSISLLTWCLRNCTKTNSQCQQNPLNIIQWKQKLFLIAASNVIFVYVFLYLSLYNTYYNVRWTNVYDRFLHDKNTVCFHNISPLPISFLRQLFLVLYTAFSHLNKPGTWRNLLETDRKDMRIILIWVFLGD